MRKRLRTVLHDLAGGRLSLSDLDELFTAFPFGEKLEAEGWLATRTAALKTNLMHTAIYPSLRKWGLVIGGAPTPPAKPCPAPAAALAATAYARWASTEAAADTAIKRAAMDSIGSGFLGLLREAHGVLGGLLQPPPPRLFSNSGEWRSAKLSKDGARVVFVLSSSKRPLSARKVDCSSGGHHERPLVVAGKEAVPLRPGQLVHVGVYRDTACFRNVYDNVYDKETASARASGSSVVSQFK